MQTRIDEAAALLNAESLRLFGVPLDEEQTEALYDDEQWRGMLEDMEARMGFRVRDAMIALTLHYECDAPQADEVANSLIGSLAHATLEPLTAEPARVPGEHVVLDARSVDHWSRNHDR